MTEFRTVKIRKWFKWIDWKFEDLRRGHLYQLLEVKAKYYVETKGLILADAAPLALPEGNYIVSTVHYKWWNINHILVRFFPQLPIMRV